MRLRGYVGSQSTVTLYCVATSRLIASVYKHVSAMARYNGVEWVFDLEDYAAWYGEDIVYMLNRGISLSEIKVAMCRELGGGVE